MFEDKARNKEIIMGAYKKLKSYFYYDKTILYNKMRLSLWESNEAEMNMRVEELAAFLTTIESSCDYKYLRMLISGIKFIPMPKSFEDDPVVNNLLQNKAFYNNALRAVNFFIQAPVELMVLDTIWMLMIDKIAADQGVLVSEAYANKVKSQIIKDGKDLIDGIDFQSNRLFVPYFKQYTAWRDKAFQTIKDRYDAAQDSVLISLDLKSYYYSVRFRFDSLSSLLNNDKRLLDVQPLTNIIEMVYVVYTSEMKKYRGAIGANFFVKECIFPIGLLSSMLLSNLYLRPFDLAIKERIQPSYYGRYVDDILIVIEPTEELEITLDSILYETLVKNNIIKPVGDNEYQTIIPTKLPLQKDKIRCIFFDHQESEAMLKLLCETATNKPSGIELMPDINNSQGSFDECAYTLGQQSGTLKVRNFLFQTNNYAATLFVNDLIRTSKSVDVEDGEYKEHIGKQIEQILKFYSGSRGIEYRSAWINVFTLILINKRFDYFCSFYNQIQNAISNIHTSKIEAIEPGKKDAIISKVKAALMEQLDLSAAIALAPMDLTECSHKIRQMFEQQRVDIESRKVFQDAKDLRNANMFNNHVLAYPLINYILDYDAGDISFVDAQPKDIVRLISANQSILPLSMRKLMLSPRFIHLDEMCMLNFLVNFTSGGSPCAGNINDLVQRFYEINQIVNVGEMIAAENNEPPEEQHLNLQSVTIGATRKNDDFTELKIAIASINLDEKRDIIPTINNPRHQLTPHKKRELYALLNEAVQSGAEMIVFPEFFLPIDWLEEVYTFSRKNSVAIISGIRYIIHDKRAYNYLVVIQPFSSRFGFKYTLPLIREKNHYAPIEFKLLRDYGKECIDPLVPYTHLIKWKNFCYSDMMCYELTDIGFRYKLKSKIELLLVPEVNPDTDYFSNIVEATSRDLHCFVAQVNTSKYGDSRITGPFNSMFKDIVKIKGGENNVLLLGTVDIEKLMDNRAGIKEKVEHPPLKRRMKDPPAGFYVAKEGAQ